MKKMLLAAPGVFLVFMIALAPATRAVSHMEWQRSITGTWAGKKDGVTYRYKLDRNAQLWWSADDKKWASVDGGMWADRDGKWLKIGEGKLWWTADGGKNFSEVPEWTWEGPDGEWYRFDAKWTLWVKK